MIVAVTDEAPRIITLAGDPAALPTGTLDPALDRTLERALRRWVREGTGIDLGYVEQLYTLGDLGQGRRTGCATGDGGLHGTGAGTGRPR